MASERKEWYLLDDMKQRLDEGWYLFPRFDSPYSGTRKKTAIKMVLHQEGGGKVVFSSDEEAQAFVQKRAAEGSEYHIEALAYIAACRLGMVK